MLSVWRPLLVNPKLLHRGVDASNNPTWHINLVACLHWRESCITGVENHRRSYVRVVLVVLVICFHVNLAVPPDVLSLGLL